MLKLDTATIYQIFQLWNQGFELSLIASETRCTTATVRGHLSLQYLHLYPDRLRKRIETIRRPYCTKSKIPAGYITLEDASYFFPTRPTARTLRENYRLLPTELIPPDGNRRAGRIKLTRPEWIRDYIRQTHSDDYHGMYLTGSAVSALTGTPAKSPLTPLYNLPDLELPDGVVSFALRVIGFTQQPFLTLTPLDILQASNQASATP